MATEPINKRTRKTLLHMATIDVREQQHELFDQLNAADGDTRAIGYYRIARIVAYLQDAPAVGDYMAINYAHLYSNFYSLLRAGRTVTA